MRKIKLFFKWLNDRANKHMYWNKPPPGIWHTEQWGHSVRVANSALVARTVGQEVKKKKCNVCGCEVWSNNNRGICGKLNCWLKGNK